MRHALRVRALRWVCGGNGVIKFASVTHTRPAAKEERMEKLKKDMSCRCFWPDLIIKPFNY